MFTYEHYGDLYRATFRGFILAVCGYDCKWHLNFVMHKEREEKQSKKQQRGHLKYLKNEHVALF